jgi:hypothetical protein
VQPPDDRSLAFRVATIEVEAPEIAIADIGDGEKVSTEERRLPWPSTQMAS